MDHVLIDTDVLLDFFYDRAPFAEPAAKVLDLCADDKIKGFVTPVIISNLYYLLRKSGKHEVIIEKLNILLTIVDLVKIDKQVVAHALNSDFKDFEDALQNYAAVEKGTIKIILTRNLKDFKKSELAIFTPELYLKGIGL